jgi:hypothetical protein
MVGQVHDSKAAGARSRRTGGCAVLARDGMPEGAGNKAKTSAGNTGNTGNSIVGLRGVRIIQAFRWIRRHPVCTGGAWRKPAEIGGNSWQRICARNRRHFPDQRRRSTAGGGAKTVCGNCGKCGSSPIGPQGDRLFNSRRLERGHLDLIRDEHRSKRTQGVGVCSCGLSAIHRRGIGIP